MPCNDHNGYFKSQGFVMPNYNNSVANLGAAILKRFKALRKNNVKPLKLGLDFEKIVLILVDGLSIDVYESVLKAFSKKRSSIARQDFKTITSVFPSSTQTAIPSLLSGLTPLQHGMIGYKLFIKKAGALINVLPFTISKAGKSTDFRITGWKFRQLFNFKTVFELANAETFAILPKTFKATPINDSLYKGVSKALFYNDFKALFLNIEKVLSIKREAFIYAYIDTIDVLNHAKGMLHKTTLATVKKLFFHIDKFLKKLPSNARVLITSDHGFIAKASVVNIYEKAPRIKELQAIPVQGEFSVRYITLKTNAEQEFLKLYNAKLSKFATLFSRQEFLNTKILGFGKPFHGLKHFIGDYVLIPKLGHVLAAGTVEKRFKSFHGGLSKQEMTVPLIIA